MKKYVIIILTLILLAIAACSAAPKSGSPKNTIAGPAVLLPSPTPSPYAALEKTPTASLEAIEAIPTPALFDIPWEDRSVFEAGLLEGDKDTRLSSLEGASVYHLELNIDPDMTHLTGREEVHYTNREDAPLEEVYFRLFPNLLDGSSEVFNLEVSGQPVEARFSLADSAMEVPLSPPLSPGESVVIAMGFAVEIPTEAGATYGALSYLDGILALAHIYPMIAVYDDEGWNIEIPPTYGDVVYSDSSFFLTRVTAPADQIVVASGVKIKKEGNEGNEGNEDTQTITFAAGPMRDFYLAAGNDYSLTSQIVDGTTINSYAPADLSTSAQLALDYAVDALNTYNHRFGAYPFTELDLIATPTLAGGIEYPGLIVVALSLYEKPDSFFELVTAHEVAHQWFYSVVGNDQIDHPWLDESLTQYAVWTYFRDVYGEQGSAGFEDSMEDLWRSASDTDAPIGMPVAAYTDPDYGAIVYGRGPLFFDALAQRMGQENFYAFLSDYYQTFRWDIVDPEAFKELAEQHCACDLRPLFEEWVYKK